MRCKSAVEIHCAQTARDALADEDLEWLVDLIINRLQPQAVNLLLNNFGSMNEAAKKDEIGREISLYVYFQKGDDDGIPEHAGIKANPNAAAIAAASSTTGQAEQLETPLPAAAKTGNADDAEIPAEQQEETLQAATAAEGARETAPADPADRPGQEDTLS